MDIFEAIATRRSVRAFRPDPVPRETVERILQAAARAPSGSNVQPWKVYVLTGAARERLSRAALAFREANPHVETPQYQYYPTKWREPYLARRRKVGWDLYGLLGIAKGEREKAWRQHNRNFRFFDAPVGMIFTIDRDLELGSWLDFGMFLENLMLAARGAGLDTCAQGAWVYHHEQVREALPVPDDQMVVCGMALGVADETAPENRLRTERAGLAELATFLDD